MSYKRGGRYWFGQVFSWRWGREKKPPGSILLLLSGRMRTQKGETVNRGVSEAENRMGTDKPKCRCSVGTSQELAVFVVCSQSKNYDSYV